MNGITINIDPEIVRVGGFALRWYSLTFAAGIGLAILLVLRAAKEKGLDTNKVGNVAFWAVLGGVAGARLFHVLDKLSFYLDNPHHIFMVSQGGLAIWGGLLVGGAAALLAARREGLPVLKLADVSAIGLVAGQAVGRIGCIINGDTVGGPTSMPWGFIYTNPGAMVAEGLRGIPVHPYPAYEMLFDIGLLGVLLVLRRRALPDGLLFLAYAAVYSLGRFGLSAVRVEDTVLWGLQQAQLIALGAFVAALAGMAALRKTRTGWRAEKLATD